MAAVMKEWQCNEENGGRRGSLLPREAAIFTASINDSGSVSLTAPEGYPAGYYAPYYDQLAKAAQQRVVPENTYKAFCPAPTSNSLSIIRVPVSSPPSDPAHLQKAIADAVHCSLSPLLRHASLFSIANWQERAGKTIQVGTLIMRFTRVTTGCLGVWLDSALTLREKLTTLRQPGPPGRG